MPVGYLYSGVHRLPLVQGYFRDRLGDRASGSSTGQIWTLGVDKSSSFCRITILRTHFFVCVGEGFRSAISVSNISLRLVGELGKSLCDLVLHRTIRAMVAAIHQHCES